MSLAGRILYQTWHRPRAWWNRVRQNGGLRSHLSLERDRAEMEQAAASLHPPPPASGAPLELHLLTGARFWYQTAFCLVSLATHARRPLHPIIYDDGSLSPRFRDSLLRLCPLARIVGVAEQVGRLEKLLPAAQFPTLRERWSAYPHIRKIIAPHLGSNGWKLVLDSDLLFFRRPDLLIDWLDQPDRPLHAVDCVESYGYPRDALDQLAGHPLAPLVNVGLAGLRSDEIDWERLEHWSASLISRHGTHYVLEQALVAMLMAGRECIVAPAADYVTNPALPEAEQCRAVMHHYVADSKRWYFGQNWRRFSARPAATSQ